MKLRTPIVAPKLLNFLSRVNGFKISGYFFFPFIFINRPEPKNTVELISWKSLVRHESIHWYQCAETLIIGFILIYFYSYLIGRIKGLSHYDAYRAVAFEREAYGHQYNEKYHNQRKAWAWVKYL